MPDEAAQGSKYDLRLTKSVEDLRNNAKWTLIAFGAIGTTLLAGSQLSSLGKFGLTEPRFLVAVACALIAMAAATFAVWSALKVANSGYVEFYALDADDVAFIERNAALLEGFGTVQNLREAYDNAIRARYASITAAQVDLDTFNSNEIWFKYLDGLVDIVVSYIHYNRIKTQSERSRSQLIASCIVAALSLLGFAWAANPGTDLPTVLQSPASPAKLTLTAAGKTTLTKILGAKCVEAQAIDVIILNATTSGWEVVTLAAKDCPIARFTLTPAMGKLSSTTAAANAAPSFAPGPADTNKAPIIWTQLRPDADTAKGQLIARAIVAPDASCPTLTVDGARWPMSIRADGSDPDFPVKMCEAALPGNAKAQLGDAALKQRPADPHKILVIGDTGCRITDYAAQPCDSAVDWPFFRVAQTATTLKPDLIVHVGDYHYREKPCAGQSGCTGSSYGDNWATWNADFFTPAAALLTAAPWLMLRGNHEDCTRAGAGWNLLIRPQIERKRGERCPVDVEPDFFEFDHLRMFVPDTGSADAYGNDKRVLTYREHIRKSGEILQDTKKENWLVTHQALWVSYGKVDDAASGGGANGSYDADDLLTRMRPVLKTNPPDELCKKLASPMNEYRLWLDGKMPAEARPGEAPCVPLATGNGATSNEKNVDFLKPQVSLVLSGDTHTFQVFAPKDDASLPLQVIAGNGGDTLESQKSFPQAINRLFQPAVNLFGHPGDLWMYHAFGFVMLEKPQGATDWTATLHDIDGKAIVICELKRPGGGCRRANNSG